MKGVVLGEERVLLVVVQDGDYFPFTFGWEVDSFGDFHHQGEAGDISKDVRVYMDGFIGYCKHL
jgi:hypothetical protein